MNSPGQNLKGAFETLGLNGPADAAVVAQAFRLAVKGARPDLPGGDEVRFRQIIAAYRLIQSQGTVRPTVSHVVDQQACLPLVVVTPLQALSGAETTVQLGSRSVQVFAPAGSRTGDRIRVRAAREDGADLYLDVLIRPTDGLLALGDDLHMRWGVPPRLLEDGGRVEIETYAGIRSAWLTPDLQAPIRLRLRDLGLPARSDRPAGHLFVTLFPSEDVPSAAEDLLARFARVWTPERLAA